MMQAIFDADNNNDDRVLYLSSDISDVSVSDICKQILSINDIDRRNLEKFRNYAIKPIQLHIQSFGGSVYDMWALIDIIESSNTPIITYCSGYCMSAAAFIFLAGHMRCMYKNSQLMLHQMFTMVGGKINDVVIEQKQMDKLHKKGIKFLKRKTNLPKKFYERYDKAKEDIYLSPKKCKKYGICDDIVSRTDWREALLEQMAASEEDECC